MLFDQVTNNESKDPSALPLAPAVTIPSDAVDMELLNAFAELQTDDEPDLIVELIDLYLEDAPQRITAIRKASVATEWVLLKRAAHNLKGSSGNLGVRHVAEVCAELETVCPDSPERVPALVQLLEYRFAKARQTLATERRRRLQ